ncbi:unnamed protein product [Lasius platythorax]|uniref:Glucose dehydrogenase n=2 Tax=Lasius TaxID=488720 RepID=A0A0J7P4K3_LASNI|nr:glucose dehydrogenase [Lasius niger]
MNLNALSVVRCKEEIQYVGGHGCIIIPTLLKLENRDRIILLASDINVKPEIVPNCFDDPEDVEMMIAGIRNDDNKRRSDKQ